ncbi:hypothetical protein BIU97_10325 [Curtobacterium sp. MCBA15_009]|uniref:hypothetical protein n=1 Tax=Curtobacterium sp. MCBA15_009 TaxID=1898737 RepID=UPI0008DE7B28|nr:hypothetical protein [Curtobacterium sp. MCBA15_009]OII10514.1 hypothetical protein BIU97_10325 [Curtobacterium sp. MCBA15_009]
MPKLAKTIVVNRRGQREFSLTVDGEEFGYLLAREPITTTTDPEDLGTVNLTLIAARITVVDDSTFSNQHGNTDLSPDAARDLLNKQRGVHDGHDVVQHRDGKPPWCNHCGLTSDGKQPVSRFRD